MKVIQTNEFARAVKKLPTQQKSELDVAVKAIMADPLLGEAKVADLAGVRVYKFKMNKQLSLLGYEYSSEMVTLFLLKPGRHETAFRDLTNSL